MIITNTFQNAIQFIIKNNLSYIKMCRPITQDDLDMIKTINLKDIIQGYQYILILGSISYLSYHYPLCM